MVEALRNKLHKDALASDAVFSGSDTGNGSARPSSATRRTPRRSPNRIIELSYAGSTPSKKNNLRPARGGGGFYYPAEVRDAMNNIYQQLESQWTETIITDNGPIEAPQPPLTNPAMAFVWYVSQRGMRSDRDGALTTVLDEMVKVGIIRDDSINSWNGPCLIASAIRTDGWAGCRIFIEQKGNLGRLWRFVQGVPDLATCRLQKPPVAGFRMQKAPGYRR